MLRASLILLQMAELGQAFIFACNDGYAAI